MKNINNKRGIKKKTRNILISITCILLICVISLLIYEINHKEYYDEKKVLYNYITKSNIDYEVFLKPNILYEDSSLDSDNVYINNLIDYINVDFRYFYNGQDKAVIRGDYEIIAEVEGYTKDGEKSTTLWKKEFNIFRNDRFYSNNKSIFLEKDIKLNLAKYNDFAKQVSELTKINCPVQLKVFMKVNLNADTAVNIIEETASPYIVIPLDENYFTISGELSQEKDENIEETTKIEIPYNESLVIIYYVLIAFLLIILIVLFRLKNLIVPSPLELELRKIFKKHGNRLVALKTDISAYDKNIITVNTIDDLVRISDEVSIPIMYKYCIDYNYITKFFIIDKEHVYLLDLNYLEGEITDEVLNKQEN